MQTDIRVDTGSGNPTSLRAIHNWKVGQILKAVVISNTPRGYGGGHATLQLGNNRYTVRSQTPLKSGQVLTLEVKRLSPNPILQRLNTPSPQGTGQLERNIAALLSHQVRMSDGLRMLLSYRNRLDPITNHHIDQLLSKLPTATDLSQPANLRDALMTSGNHFENRLLQGKPPAPADIKSQLELVLSSLPASVKHPLHHTLKGMIGRISLNQLQSMQQSTPTQTHLAVELPIQMKHDFHNVRIEIEADKQNTQANSPVPPNWMVKLQLSPPGLGQIEIHVTGSGKNISARFWAERSATVHQLDRFMGGLATALKQNGLKPGTLDAYHGQAPARKSEFPQSLSGLLDTQA